MAWLRWHEGSVTDPKFQWVARECEQPVAFVLAVWAALLERASMADDRGNIEGFDHASTDVLLGMPDGTTLSICNAMRDKGLVTDSQIVKWDERQPKKEDETAVERKREERARKKQASLNTNAQCHAVSHDVTESHGMSQNVTPCHAVSHHVTLDEIRKEENIKNIKKESSLRSDSCAELSCDTSSHQHTPAENPSLASCPDCELEKPPEITPVILLPLNTGQKHPVMPADVAHYQELYPAVDVMQQLRAMLGWLEANPKKRKTKGGIKKFINGWLAGKQDKGGCLAARASPQADLSVAPTEFQKRQQEGRIMSRMLLEYKKMKKQDIGHGEFGRIGKEPLALVGNGESGLFGQIVP